jgi:hypothetical protein
MIITDLQTNDLTDGYYAVIDGKDDVLSCHDGDEIKCCNCGKMSEFGYWTERNVEFVCCDCVAKVKR